MAIDICPKCGTRVQPREEAKGEVFTECKACGFRAEFKDWVEHICPKCEHNKAIVLYHAMTIGDEDTTTIFKCLNCGETDKEGFK
jgi:DNA-directed RNA polymerase subunit M/transcription elongation factor TFIIS